MTKYEKDLKRIEKKPLTIEQISWQRQVVRQLPTALFECANLKELDLWRNHLEELPEVIGQLENLEVLKLSNNKIKRLPKSLLRLKKLKKLIVNNNEITEFPTFLMQHPSLQELNLQFNPIATIPDFGAKNTTLKILVVGNNELISVSPCLQQLQGLERLGLSYGQLTDLPIELENLQQLRYLEFHNSLISKLPACLEKLDELVDLRVNLARISALPEWIRHKKKVRSISFSYEPRGTMALTTFPPQLIPYIRTATINGLTLLYPQLSIADFERLWKQFKTRAGTEEDDLRYLHLFTGDERISTHPKAKIVADLLETKEILVAQNAIQFLTRDSHITNPLQAGSELALLGKLDLKDIRIVKKRMKDAGLKLVKVPTEKTTHWYISRKIVGEYQQEYEHLPFLNSEQLMQYLDEVVPQFLVENQENISQNSEKIRQFFFSHDESSQLLAFEMIKNGGLPKELFTDLFYLYQTHENATVRKRARTIVKQHASPKFLQNMRVRQRIIDVYHTHYKFNQFWTQVVVGTELDEVKILQYMVRDYGTQSYAMPMLLDHSEVSPADILKYAVTNGKLQLRGERQAELIPYLKNFPHLRALELWGIKFEEFPKEVLAMKSLESLYLREVTLNEIPESIHELKNLTHLNLRVFGLKKMPNLGKLNLTELHLQIPYEGDLSAVLKGLNQLKRLNIGGGRNIESMSNILASCTNLEFLSLRFVGVTELPDDLSSLQKLTELHLNYMKLETFPEVLTKLPALRKIKVVGNSETFFLLKEGIDLFHLGVELG